MIDIPITRTLHDGIEDFFRYSCFKGELGYIDIWDFVIRAVKCDIEAYKSIVLVKH